MTGLFMDLCKLAEISHRRRHWQTLTENCDSDLTPGCQSVHLPGRDTKRELMTSEAGCQPVQPPQARWLCAVA
jgi:hypothetical protein